MLVAANYSHTNRAMQLQLLVAANYSSGTGYVEYGVLAHSIALWYGRYGPSAYVGSGVLAHSIALWYGRYGRM